MAEDVVTNADVALKHRDKPLNEKYDYHSLGDGSHPTMRSEAGVLRYLTNTRPDLLVAAGIIGRGAHKPSDCHRRGWKYLVQYLDSTKEETLTLGGEGDVELFGLCDASYLAAHDSLSTLGFAYFVNLNSGTICCRSKRARTVSHSSAESEVAAMDECFRQAVWLRGMLAELGHPQLKPTVIYSDSKSAIALATLSKIGDNSGHITMRINYLREQIQAGTVRVIFINTEANIADILTKPLPADLHREFSSVLLHGFGGVPPIASPLFSNEELNRRTFAKMKAARQRQLVARRDKAPSAAALSAIERAMDSSTLSAFRLEP